MARFKSEPRDLNGRGWEEEGVGERKRKRWRCGGKGKGPGGRQGRIERSQVG